MQLLSHILILFRHRKVVVVAFTTKREPRPNIGNRQRNHAFHPRNGLWPGFGVEEGEIGGCLILITVIADGPNRSAISLTWTSRGHVRSRVVTLYDADEV